MPKTADILRDTTWTIHTLGLRTGRHFLGPDGCLSIGAAIYVAAHGTIPAEFATDERISIAIITASAPAMQAIKTLSQHLDTQPNVDTIAPGYEVPDHLDHIEYWAAHGLFGSHQPPTADEVIDHLNATADALDAPQALAA
ncbi:DUF6197 family protein [Streptomyces decoyicus]